MDNWYYVQLGERKGPVAKSVITNLISEAILRDEDFIWKKGMDNWAKIKDISEFSTDQAPPLSLADSELPGIIDSATNSLMELASSETCIFIKIGADRGADEVEYGPYSISILQKLFEQKRINGKTFAFIKGMKNWSVLADFSDFVEIFEDSPPAIKDEDRRASNRKPFIARMYIKNRKEVFTGICRDISIGGMQVLVDHFPSNVGDTISINVHPENTDYHFVADGHVVRSLDGGQGFSFRFSSLSAESQNAINKYLKSSE